MQQSDVYYQLLSQHVSGIIMHIFRRTNTCVTAYGLLRWFCWMWLVAVCSPEDGHNDARNMLRQKFIINIWLFHLVGFLSLHTCKVLF